MEAVYFDLFVLQSGKIPAHISNVTDINYPKHCILDTTRY